jgi:iron(III) transport system substrate-binding protein
VHKNAPHPNAAKLLADFIISKEGQQVFRDADYITSHPDIPALEPTLKPKEGGFRVQFFTPEQTEEQMAEWKKVSDEFFR